MHFHKLSNPIVCFLFSCRHHQPQICLRCGRKDRQDAQTIPRTRSQQVQSIRFRFLFMRTYEHGLCLIVSFYDAQVFTRSISALWLASLQVNTVFPHIVSALFQEHIHNKFNRYAFGFFLCELMNMVFALLSVFMTHKFLLDQYLPYGWQVYR